MQIKIISWNIWVDGDFKQTADFLKSSGADIMGLQEVRDDIPDKDVLKYLSELGYEYIFEPAQSLKGVKFGPALISKYPIKEKIIYTLSETDKRVAVGADININGTTLHIFSTHLMHTHQQPSNTQEEQAKNIVKFLPKDHSIVMGDFNASPESNAIKIMKEAFSDSDTLSQPTWCLYKEGCDVCNIEDISIRLDYIFTTKDIGIESFKVEKSEASDHLPISLIIKI